MEAPQRGGTAAWRHRSVEAPQRGGTAAWRHRGLEAPRLGLPSRPQTGYVAGPLVYVRPDGVPRRQSRVGKARPSWAPASGGVDQPEALRDDQGVVSHGVSGVAQLGAHLGAVPELFVTGPPLGH